MRIANLCLNSLWVVIFLPACNRHAVSLDYTNAHDEVPQPATSCSGLASPGKDSLLNPVGIPPNTSASSPPSPAVSVGAWPMSCFFLPARPPGARYQL